MNKQTCDICKEPVTDQSTDIWALETWYEKSGDVHETGRTANLNRDYLVICTRPKCQATLKGLWDDFVQEVGEGNSVLSNRREVTEVDNRDASETWLWLGRRDRVEVDPVDLVENMIENNRQWIIEEEGVDAIDLERALEVLNKARGR